jgi:hypothetical protein
MFSLRFDVVPGRRPPNPRGNGSVVGVGASADFFEFLGFEADGDHLRNVLLASPRGSLRCGRRRSGMGLEAWERT